MIELFAIPYRILFLSLFDQINYSLCNDTVPRLIIIDLSLKRNMDSGDNGPSCKDDCYPPVGPLPNNHNGRISQLVKIFWDKFQSAPQFFVRVPGRVNLIGEHVDYCGYSVCPMAIQCDILVAARRTTDKVLHIVNSDSKHHDFKCDIPMCNINFKKGTSPEWHNYFLCGVKGVLEELPEGVERVGMQVAVDGNIPLASGLSSSSALVCAAALTTTYANEHKMTKLDLATLCACSEHYIGTQGGGMDQAIAFLGTQGSAKHIEFNPLRSEDVRLPEGAVFVIAHSLATANKAQTSDYNCRVAECRLATQMLAKVKGLSWEKMQQLAALQQEMAASLEQMISYVKETLHEEPYTKQEICEELGVSEMQLNELSLSNNTTQIMEFKLRQRALHVYEEAKRVEAFREVCGSDVPAARALVMLGDILRDSHDSLQHQYECSHPALDQLVALSRDWALGSRLTGAGWGGCLVALTTRETVEDYIATLKREYYKTNPRATGRNMADLVFATEPNAGAQIFTAQ